MTNSNTSMRQGDGGRNLDEAVSNWILQHGVLLSRITLGIVYVWFGAPKLIPGLSSAEDLACRTLVLLTGGQFDGRACVMALGIGEILIGLWLLTGRWPRIGFGMLLLHMAGTATPFLLFPGEMFVRFPVALSFSGQYIVKNLVLVSTALVAGAALRRGRRAAGQVIAPGKSPSTGRRMEVPQ